jgi:hypothetical protein
LPVEYGEAARARILVKKLQEDFAITCQIKEAGKVLGLPIQDYLTHDG